MLWIPFDPTYRQLKQTESSMEATKKEKVEARYIIVRQIRETILFSFALGQPRLSRDAAKDETQQILLQGESIPRSKRSRSILSGILIMRLMPIHAILIVVRSIWFGDRG